MALTVRAARLTDALEFGGAKPFLRKALLAQIHRYPSIVVERLGEPVALAMVAEEEPGQAELAVAFRPGAAAAISGLIRLARLTLLQMRHDGIEVWARVAGSRGAAPRLARLTGFRSDATRGGSHWRFEG